MTQQFTIFETFVGAGGSHIGFKQEGFKTVYVNDCVPDCIKTLVHNNPELITEGAYIDQRSIEDIDVTELSKTLNLPPKSIDVFFGGVVCKGFSLAGQRNPMDERNYLYRKQLELVKTFRPKISIIENVAGIINAKVYAGSDQSLKQEISELWNQLEKHKGKKAALRKKGQVPEHIIAEETQLTQRRQQLLDKISHSADFISVLDDIKRIYTELGYNVYHKVLNSAWYGAATKRERVIIVAVRQDLNQEFIYPEPQYMDKSIFKGYMPTEYLTNLPSPPTVNQALAKIDYTDLTDLDNQPMKHNDKTVARFKYIAEGCNIQDCIDQLPEDLKVSKFYSRGSTMRLNGNSLSPTLVPGHSNFPVHPKEHRSITVREAATITGFPVDYKFFGSHTKRCEHVGNAVPPPLARVLAQECKRILTNYYNSIQAKYN